MNSETKEPLKPEEIADLVVYYKDNLHEEHIQVDIMYAKKVNSKSRLYKTWMLVCRNEDILGMLSETLSNMENMCSSRSIDKYDLELSTDETIQTVDEEKVLNYPELRDAVTVEYSEENIINEGTDYDKFDFAVIKLSDNADTESSRESITILKKHYKAPAKFKGTKSFVFNGSEAIAYSKPMLIIGSNVEAFNIDNFFYVVNRDNFNTMLNFKDVYYKIVDSNTEEIIQSDLFDNPALFIEECRNNGRYVTRLTKAILAEGFKNVKENKGKLSQLKENYHLNLSFTEEGKIVYNKEHVNEILNLLLEHYVTSALTDKKMLALAVEKYE